MNRLAPLFMLFLAIINVTADVTIRQQPKNVLGYLMREVLQGTLFNSISSIAEDPSNLPNVFAPTLTLERDIGILLFTRKNPNEPAILKIGDIVSLKNVNFKNVSTKIIIHGWTDSGKSIWVEEFRKNYLSVGDYNIIIIDWLPGASKEYLAATRVTRQVGDYVSEFLKFLVRKEVLTLDNVHILGHSLGAHIAGFIGSNFHGKIARITGMDPARPDFEAPLLRNPKDRLDTGDAKFVDVIHTCAGTVGFIRPIGHIDFYPNGGSFRQPGCPVLTTQFCSHARSHQFMSESIINPFGFPALECDGWKDFKSKNCNSVRNQVVYMGEKLSQYARGVYFLQTNSVPPFGRGEV